MKQQTFSDIEYINRKRKTKREEFLEIMDEIIPWDEWVSVIVPYYPSGKRGRPPKGIEKMLRMYLLQVWFNLSDEGTENAIYDSYAMRKFVGINFLEEDAPDATTLLKFRRLLEQHGLNKLFFEAINRVMVATGHMLKGGTVVDATIINASPSTKNAEKQRDPEMHQTKKGNEWRFGMKCHIGVDAFSGLAHTLNYTNIMKEWVLRILCYARQHLFSRKMVLKMCPEPFVNGVEHQSPDLLLANHRENIWPIVGIPLLSSCKYGIFDPKGGAPWRITGKESPTRSFCASSKEKAPS